MIKGIVIWVIIVILIIEVLMRFRRLKWKVEDLNERMLNLENSLKKKESK